VLYGDTVIVDTTQGYRVLETSHPPTYYFPPADVNTEYLTRNARSSFCEWKGVAAYFDFKGPNGQTIKSRFFQYPEPSKSFKPITNFFSCYASPFKCFVDDEEVSPQPGDFYSGWMDSSITGGERGVKGGPGTFGW